MMKLSEFCTSNSCTYFGITSSDKLKIGIRCKQTGYSGFNSLDSYVVDIEYDCREGKFGFANCPHTQEILQTIAMEKL